MNTSRTRAGLCLVACSTLIATTVGAVPASAAPGDISAGSPGVVINEAYLSGGSANAVYRDKFIELFNQTDAPISVAGWSLQYRSATGTGATNTSVPLSGTVPAHGTFLVGGGSNGGNGAELPTPDLATSFNPSGTRGTIVLSNQKAPLNLPTGSVIGNTDVSDLLGYGNSNTFETAAATAPDGNTDPRSLERPEGVDTDHNAADFSLNDAPSPTPSGATEPDPDPDPDPTEPVDATIAEIQGTGDTTPLKDQLVTTRGVVTASYPTGGYDGYYLQTEGTGGDDTSAASDGLFIYSAATVGEVQVGDHVEVTGTAGEFHGLTQLNVPAGGATVLDEPAEAVKALTVPWPTTDGEREAYEGMLWAPEGQWTLADNYALNTYGELGLAFGTSKLVRGATTLIQPTDVAPAGSQRAAAVEAENLSRSITLDDGSTANYLGSATNQDIPLPYLAPGAQVRVGAPVDFIGNVILDYRHDAWRFQPLTRLTGANTGDQPAAFGASRAASPRTVGGDVQIATFNVLNYFTTTGDQLTGCSYYTDRAGNPLTVRGGCEARGAANAENLERQQAKIVAAINGLDADVVSLEEIENSAAFGKDRDAALANLVDALNRAVPRPGHGHPGKGHHGRGPATWKYVPSPRSVPADEDVIRTGFIYRKAAVKPVGSSVILDDEAFSNARPPLAQAFTRARGAKHDRFVTIVNHFKSKGSNPDDGSGNADTGDGQGAWNAARVQQAEALVDFAGTMKRTAKTAKIILTGDFNSYTQEDPMQVLYRGGFTDLGSKTGKASYLFAGRTGSLDHVLVSDAAARKVTGQDIWDINADEPIALEYSRYNYNVSDFYAPDPYRASDHDPMIVGLKLGGRHGHGHGHGKG
ncbi:ExeM/NucH family extracellular endonuclease [Arthrobacter rhombi]|uniref:ExeM/NucH family extracellular endonuclease n=1 Tax=Arthrobacter rhombi TaxID=71253 RepID=UPI003FD36FEF